MQCDDPEAVAERWGLILRRPVLDAGDNVRVMNVDNAEARFTPLADDRGEGETEVYLRCADAGAVLVAAEREKARTGEINGKPFFEACGVRFLLV